MFNFRAFSRSLDPEGGRYAAGDMTPTELSGERMVFEAVVERGPFRGRALTLTYEGDFEQAGDEVFGTIARVTLAIDGATHFEIVPAEPVDVDDFDDFLKDVGKLLDRDDEDDDEDDGDEDDGDEDDGDEDDGDEDDEDEDFDAVEDLVEALWGKGLAFRGSRRDDDFDGDDGDDEMDGGEGEDDLFGGKGADKLEGGEGDDDLAGGRGSDRLLGGKGDDELDGGRGADVMNGGRGADTFIFVELGDLGVGRFRDVVRGFAGGKDAIDLSGIDADLGRSGDQRFAFIEDGAFSERGRELRFEGGVLRGDIDGDGAADFHIKLGGAALTSDDFVF